MRNATSILLFGASSLVLSIVACGGDDGNGMRGTAGAGQTSAGSPATAGNGPAAAGNGPSAAGNSSAAGTPSTGGAPACAPTAGNKKGDGANNVIDEIDDANTMFAPAGTTASGSWDFSKDASTGTITPAGTMTLVPVDGGQAGKGFNIKGTGLTGWGAALAAILNGTANSFDASAYGGVAFYAKGTSDVFEGKNKLFVTARMYELLPGVGTCCKDPTDGMPNGTECYATHFKVVDLTADWKEVKITWADFGKRMWGLGAATDFNANRLRDIVFGFNHDGAAATGTPMAGASFDVWIDGLRFLGKDEMGNVGGGTAGAGGQGTAGSGGATAGGGNGGASGGGNGGAGGQ